MDDTPGKETTYHFDADRANVAYGQAITSWIEVWKNGDPQKKLPIDVEDAWVDGRRRPEDRSPREALLSRRRPGRRRGRRRRPLFESFRAVAAAAAQASVASAPVGDGERRRRAPPVRARVHLCAAQGRRRSSASATPRAPARSSSPSTSTSTMRGTYDFEANLMSGDGSTPLGYTQMNYTLSPGRQTVDLVFFGRMFQERSADGPYLVRDVRGLLLASTAASTTSPSSTTRRYLTKPWRHSEFSGSAVGRAGEAREDRGDGEGHRRHRVRAHRRADVAAAAHRHRRHGVAHVVNDPPPPVDRAKSKAVRISRWRGARACARAPRRLARDGADRSPPSDSATCRRSTARRSSSTAQISAMWSAS